MHYLYTTFRYATVHGTPIIRPMFYEFPGDSNTFTLDHQFMFGDSMLVAPKISPPTEEHIDYHSPVMTSVYLPPNIYWYYYFSGQPILGTGAIIEAPVADNEQGVWIKEGAIIPLLNFEKNRTSIL